jgi:hypothetical protein
MAAAGMESWIQGLDVDVVAASRWPQTATSNVNDWNQQ